MVDIIRLENLQLNFGLRLEEEDKATVERQLVRARLPNSRHLVKSPRCV